MNTHTLKIGQLANATGLSVDTIRFYESRGLIKSGARTASGYRQFIEDDVAKLQFVQRAKKVGFTLEEITELLALQLHPDDHTCEEVKQFTANKIKELEHKLKELSQIRDSLNTIHTACCGGPESATKCSILHALNTVNTL